MISNRGRKGRWKGGKFETHIDIILRLLKEKPRSLNELQSIMKIKRTTIRGRLSMLMTKGYIKKNHSTLLYFLLADVKPHHVSKNAPTLATNWN